MDIYLNNNKNENNDNNYCPYCKSIKINPSINISNFVYDQYFVSLINSISSHIKNFYQKLTKVINEIKNVSISLESQINHSKYLLKVISLSNSNNLERYRQLCDRIDMINESKKILDDNLSLVNKNLSIFISDVKIVFKKMKIIRTQKINQALNNVNIREKKIIHDNKNNFELKSYDSYRNNKKRNIRQKYLFDTININEENNFIRRVLSPNQSPKNSLNMSNNGLEYLMNSIKVNEFKKKNNSTLIFPNNINQNIFNCTITSKEFKSINNNPNLECFNKIYNNKTAISRNNKIINSKLLNKKKVNRSSSIPEMIYQNKKLSSNNSLSNKMNYTIKSKNNSLPKKNDYNNVNNNNYINNNNNNYNKNMLIKLSYKVKEFLDILNNNNLNKNDILNEKVNDLEKLINNIIKINNNANINKNLRNSNSNNVDGSNNNIELLKKISFLTKKLKDLEDKIKQKEEIIEESIKNNNREEKILLEKSNNEIKELNKNISLLKKENTQLKAEIIELTKINQEAENLNQIIKEKDLEIEKLKINNNEIKKSIDSKKEINEQNLNINEINNLKIEINKKEEKVNELNKSIKIYEEKQIKQNNEINKLKEENIELSKRIEELKNNLNEKDKIINNINEQLENYKKQIEERKNSADEAKKNSQYLMEIASLKKINSKLNKMLKKKNIKINEDSISDDTNSNKLNDKNNNYNISIQRQVEISYINNNIKMKNMNNMNNNIEDNNINNNIDNIKNINNNSSALLTLSRNSFTNEIVNYNSKEFNQQYEKLNEENNSLKEQLNQAQTELSIYKNEFKCSKIELDELKSKINNEKKKQENNYTPDKYNILCDKNYNKLQWFLLIPKDKKFDNNYDFLTWVEKTNITDINKFNKFESEIELQNKTIIDHITKLEKKEEIISKLTLKLNNFEKKADTHSNFISSNNDVGVSLEKFNLILNQLNDAEDKLKILQQENAKLKQSIINKKKVRHKHKSDQITEGSNQLGYDKKYELNIKEEDEGEGEDHNINENENEKINNINDVESDDENESVDYSETDTEMSELRNELENAKIQLNKMTIECKNLENKIKIIKESFSNLLIKMNIPKKFKEEIKEILKLFDFTEGEILFIVDKKKQFY